MVLHNTDFLSALGGLQRDMLAMLLLKLRDHQITAAETHWGVWLFPLAFLVYRSRFMPPFLAVWLAFGGLAYVALVIVTVLWPQHRGWVLPVMQPATFGEIAFMLWLTIKGARAFLPLLGIPREACGGVFIEENAHQGRSPALHPWEKCARPPAHHPPSS